MSKRNFKLDPPESLFLSILGSLIVRPALFYDINDKLQPFMFPEHMQPIADVVWDFCGKGQPFTVGELIVKTGESELIQKVITSRQDEALLSSTRTVSESYLAKHHLESMQRASIRLGNGDNYREVIAEMEGEIKTLESFITPHDNFASIVDRVYNLSREIREGITTKMGISTGFKDLDRLIGGWQPGQYCLICARPFVGKTTLMLQHVLIYAASGIPSAFFSLELPKEMITLNAIAAIARIPRKKLMNPDKHTLTQAEWDHFTLVKDKIKEWPLFLRDSKDLRGSAIVARDEMIGLANNEGCRLFGIDYIQLFRAHTRRQSRNYELEDISRELNEGTKLSNATSLIGSQLHRGVENRKNKRPKMSDLRDSGTLEQDADLIALLYRDDRYFEHDDQGNYLRGNPKVLLPVNVMEANIPKNRMGETTGKVYRKMERGLLQEYYLDNDFPTVKDEPIDNSRQLPEEKTDLFSPVKNDELPF